MTKAEPRCRTKRRGIPAKMAPLRRRRLEKTSLPVAPISIFSAGDIKVIYQEQFVITHVPIRSGPVKPGQTESRFGRASYYCLKKEPRSKRRMIAPERTRVHGRQIDG